MSALKFVTSVWESFRASSGLEPRLLNNVRPPKASLAELLKPCNLKNVLQRQMYNTSGGTIVDQDLQLLKEEFRLTIEQLRITSASPGRVSFELPIEKHHTNRLNILHGGTIASMVDLGGSLVLASRGLYSTGVSTDLNVTYLGSGGKVGDVIKGEAVCDKFGKTLAFTSIKFFNQESEIVARGSHTKFVAIAHKDSKNITEELKPEKPES